MLSQMFKLYGICCSLLAVVYYIIKAIFRTFIPSSLLPRKSLNGELALVTGAGMFTCRQALSDSIFPHLMGFSIQIHWIKFDPFYLHRGCSPLTAQAARGGATPMQAKWIKLDLQIHYMPTITKTAPDLPQILSWPLSNFHLAPSLF